LRVLGVLAFKVLITVCEDNTTRFHSSAISPAFTALSRMIHEPGYFLSLVHIQATVSGNSTRRKVEYISVRFCVLGAIVDYLVFAVLLYFTTCVVVKINAQKSP
jgi:hypothetical protein